MPTSYNILAYGADHHNPDKSSSSDPDSEDSQDDFDLEDTPPVDVEEIIEEDEEVPEKAARRLHEKLCEMKKHFERIDLEMLEAFGYDPEPFHELEDDLAETLLLIANRGAEMAGKIGEVGHKKQKARPMWKTTVESFSDPDKSYTVRWDEATEAEKFSKPHYSCTCPDFTYQHHDGQYCKHINAVIRDSGGGGAMPDEAKKIGVFEPDASNE